MSHCGRCRTVGRYTPTDASSDQIRFPKVIMYIPYNFMCYIPYTSFSPTVERTATLWLKCCWKWLLPLFNILLHHLKTRSQCRIKLVWTHVAKGSYVSQSRIKLVWTHVTKGSYVSQSRIKLVWTHVTKGPYISQSRIRLVWTHVTKGSYVSQSRIRLVWTHVTKGSTLVWAAID